MRTIASSKGSEIGTKLTVDGEAEFKKAMKECSNALSLLSAEGTKVSAVYAKNKDSLKGLTQQYSVASEKVKAQEQKVKLLRAELEKEVKAHGEASAKAQKYAKELNYAEAGLAKMKNQSKEAVKAMITQNKAFQTAEKAAKALAKGGLAVLEGAGKACIASIGAISAGAVAMSKAVWDAANAASEAGDAIDKGSQKMGVSAEQYQQLAYAADMSGTSIDTLQKATQKLQASGSNLNVDKALEQLYAIEDADKRAAAAHEMFGDKIANELAPMLNQGGKAFEEAKQQALDYGLVMSDSAVKASAAFGDTKTLMTDTISGIKNNLASELLPGINEVMSGITDLFSGKDGAMDKIGSGIETLMNDLGGVVDKIGNILGRIVDAIAESAPKIIPTLVEGILSNLDKLIDCAFDLIDALANGLLTPKNIDLIIKGAVKILTKLVDSLLDNIDLIIDGAMEIITSLCDALTDSRALPKIATGALDVVKALVTALIDNAPELLDSALEMGAQLVQGLIDYDWTRLAKSIYNSIKSAIIGFFKGSGGDSESQHAGGLSYVPADNSYYLHKGEKVLTASEASAYSEGSNYDMLNAKVDMLLANQQQQSDVYVNFNGTSGAIARALNVEIKRENRRASAFA